MTSGSASSITNILEERDPDVLLELREFRARFEEMLLDTLDHVTDNPRYRGRGQFLPPDDIRAIAREVRILTADSWTQDHLDQFDASWRDAMRSDLFAEAFESIRFRIENAVNAARILLADRRTPAFTVQPTLW
ncbi:MAG TPA: hypothetical protein VFE62_10345 [Gemmataceae bacterium]|nr:hypothetical protein [Gemmataceae bacterium]